MKTILVEELTKTYPGGVEALKGLSFSIEEGEIFGLLGPNGAGKSTTVKILVTLSTPTGGLDPQGRGGESAQLGGDAGAGREGEPWSVLVGPLALLAALCAVAWVLALNAFDRYRATL